MADGNVQLKLQVSLDTVYIRQQLEGLGALAKRFPLNIVPKIDSRNLEHLVKSVGKKITVNINDSQVQGLISRLETAQANIQELKTATNKIVVGVTVESKTTKKDVDKARAAALRALTTKGSSRGKLLLPVGLQPVSQAVVNAFKADLQKKLGSINIEVGTTTGAAPATGKSGGARRPSYLDAPAFKTELEKLSRATFAQLQKGASGLREGRTRAELERLLSEFAQTNPQGAQRSRDLNALREMLARGRYQQGLGIEARMAGGSGGQGGQFQRTLDTFARGLFRMLGMDPAQLRAERQARLAPPAINWPSQVPQRNIPVGPSSTGRALPGAAPLTPIAGTPSPFGILPSITRRTQVAQGVNAIMQGTGAAGGEDPAGKLALSAEALRRRVDAILAQYFKVVEAQIREEFGGADLRQGLRAFAYVAQALRDAEQRTKQARIDDAVASFLRSVENAVRLAEARATRFARVSDLGNTVRALPPARAQLMLPPAGGSGFRGGGGFVPPGGFPSDDIQGPRRNIGLSAARIGELRQHAGLLQIARDNTRNLSAAQLPLISGLRNLAGEFGEATKQVLLYGSAYKGLAFLMALPGNMLNAAKAQQQYNNAMHVATQETGTFAKEMLFVDNVQRAFGLNLQTTREGFTRLYASMAPTGFDSGSIEKLFTGISAATAALQLTPDRAERVIYAFGQMASKGQVMSEELKGQLGDALPGAVAIFAKAAGKSVQDFNKDLEDGIYTGAKFRDLMAKVTDELIERFGTGAQVAGRSLQGLLNSVQGDFQRTLEALAPFADAAAKAILLPLSRGLKSFSASAQIASGEMGRLEKQIETAKQTAADVRLGGGDESDIRAAEQNVAALQARQEQLAASMADPAIMRQAQGIKEFRDEIATAGTFIMNFAKAIGSVLSPILSFFGSNLASVLAAVISFYTGLQTARLAATVLFGALTLLRSAIALLGMGGAARQAVALRAAFAALGVSATGAQVRIVGLRVALTALVASTVVGAVIAGIGLIAAAFMSMGNEAKDAADKAKQSMESVREAAYSGNVAVVEMQIAQSSADVAGLTTASAALRSVEGRRQNVRGGGQTRGIVPAASIPSSLRAELGVLGVAVPESGMVNLDVIRSRIAEVKTQAQKTLTSSQQKLPIAQRRQREIGLNEPTPSPIAPGELIKEEDGTAKKKMEDADKLARQLEEQQIRAANQQQQLITATAEHQARLRELGFSRDQDLAEVRYEQIKGLIDAEYDYRLTRANEVQAVQLNLEKKLSEARLSSLRSIEMTELRLREARLKVENAQAKRAAAAQAATIIPEAPQAALPPGATAAPILPPAAGVTVQQLLGLSDAEVAAAVNTSIGEYGGPDPLGRTDVFANILARSRSGQYPRNLVDVVTQPGQYAPNFGRSRSQVTNPNLYGLSTFNRTKAELMNPQLLAQSVRDVDSRLYFKGISEYPNMVRGVDFLRAQGQNFFHGPGRSSPGRHPAITAQLLRDLGGTSTRGAMPASGPAFSMQRREQGAEFGVEEAQAEEKALKQVELTRLQNDLLKDVRTTAIEVSDAVGQALPLEQLTLENQLLKDRNALMLQGAPEEFIQATEKLTIAKAKSASIEAALSSQIAKAIKDQKTLKKQLDDGTISQAGYNFGIANSNALIKEYNAGLAELPGRLQAVTLETLSGTLAQLQNADALKAMQEAVEMVKGAVEGVMGSYKNFVGEVLKGGSLKDAAKRLQEALRDQSVTMFLDFAMKPMQKFLEDSLLKVFGLESEEQQRQKTITQLQEQIRLLEQIRNNTAGVGGPVGDEASPLPAGMSARGFGLGMQSYIAPIPGGISELPELQRAATMGAEASAKLGQLPSTMEQAGQALQGFQMKTALVTASLKQQATDAGASGGLLQQNLGRAVSAIGLAAGAITSIAGGVSQIKEGGVSGVLGGIGSIFMGVGGALGGFANLFPGMFAPKTAANGALWKGGFTPFANGGVVNGPTLGLVGEGKYNEAIVPLPDGRSIPVKMAGGQSVRDAMSNGGMPSYTPSMLSFSFESTKINGVEYVSRDQLELAMASTRREAVKEGAKRGMSMTLDKIQQSPSTRRAIAMGRR